MYSSAITAMQIAIINNTPNNLGNITSIAINTTNIKKTQIALANIIGSISQILKLTTQILYQSFHIFQLMCQKH